MYLKETTFSQAIQDGLRQSMELDKNVYVFGQLVNYQSGVFGSTTNLVKKFGKDRVQDFPVAESLMTSMSIGLSLEMKKKIVLVHHRIDFMLYSMDAIVNWMSLWKFKSVRDTSLSITIRAIVGKGWGQGPQHSKSFHSWFANLPGIRVAIPSNPYDAKGLLIESIFSKIPTIIIEHRSLYNDSQKIPLEPYRLDFGKANIVRKGKNITIIAIGYLNKLIPGVCDYFKKNYKTEIEHIDIRSLYPLDKKTLIRSAKKTKKVLVLDPSWKSYGASGEIVAIIKETLKDEKLFIDRLCYPDSHTPMSQVLEEKYYLNENDIITKLKGMIKK